MDSKCIKSELRVIVFFILSQKTDNCKTLCLNNFDIVNITFGLSHTAKPRWLTLAVRWRNMKKISFKKHFDFDAFVMLPKLSFSTLS